MILFKDYKTKKESLSITGLILTFFMVVAGIAGAVFKKIDADLLWFILAFHGSYIAIYWNKRVRGSKESSEIGGANE